MTVPWGAVSVVVVLAVDVSVSVLVVGTVAVVKTVVV